MEKPLRELSETEKAYIAGMLDADGCVGIMRKLSRSHAYQYDFAIRVIITNSNYDLICWLKDTVGAGHAYFKNYTYNPTWSPIHRFVLTCEVARALLKEILPYMIVKRERAETALQLPTSKRGLLSRYGRSESIYQLQCALFDKLKLMNNRSTIKEPFIEEDSV